MAEQSLIVAEFKRALRERGLTYAAVAKKLNLSIASVKRLFSGGDLSLRRVDLICELLETGLAEVLARARDRPAAPTASGHSPRIRARFPASPAAPRRPSAAKDSDLSGRPDLRPR